MGGASIRFWSRAMKSLAPARVEINRLSSFLLEKSIEAVANRLYTFDDRPLIIAPQSYCSTLYLPQSIGQGAGKLEVTSTGLPVL